jgi:hypothetical protein
MARRIGIAGLDDHREGPDGGAEHLSEALHHLLQVLFCMPALTVLLPLSGQGRFEETDPLPQGRKLLLEG